ncbi:MAG: hypothetical protein AAF772_01755 [Acidobacteriota bacterium]
MIRVEIVPEPEDLKQRPPAVNERTYWNAVRPALAAGFSHRCGYAGMRIPSGTIDHFVSRHENPALTFTWSNYRYASDRMNRKKSNAPSAKMLDPYDVHDDWFAVTLPSCQLILTDALPDAYRERALFTLKRLGLRDGDFVLQHRRHWLEQYERGDASLTLLDLHEPQLARAIRRQNWPTRADRPDA